MIKSWSADLGPIRPVMGRMTNGNEVTEFWLTEEQALFIVAKSETPRAAGRYATPA